jgi:hypothetical protein
MFDRTDGCLDGRSQVLGLCFLDLATPPALGRMGADPVHIEPLTSPPFSWNGGAFLSLPEWTSLANGWIEVSHQTFIQVTRT